MDPEGSHCGPLPRSLWTCGGVTASRYFGKIKCIFIAVRLVSLAFSTGNPRYIVFLLERIKRTSAEWSAAAHGAATVRISCSRGRCPKGIHPRAQRVYTPGAQGCIPPEPKSVYPRAPGVYTPEPQGSIPLKPRGVNPLKRIYADGAYAVKGCCGVTFGPGTFGATFTR